MSSVVTFAPPTELAPVEHFQNTACQPAAAVKAASIASGGQSASAPLASSLAASAMNSRNSACSPPRRRSQRRNSGALRDEAPASVLRTGTPAVRAGRFRRLRRHFDTPRTVDRARSQDRRSSSLDLPWVCGLRARAMVALFMITEPFEGVETTRITRVQAVPHRAPAAPPRTDPQVLTTARCQPAKAHY
jgi:hypothetical protein